MELKKTSSFSQRLKEILAEKDISITEFAKKLSYSKQAISAYVNGTRFPKRPVIITIAQLLNVSEMWLCGYDVPKDRSIAPSNESLKDDKTVISIGRGGERKVYEISDEDAALVNAFIEKMAKKS